MSDRVTMCLELEGLGEMEEAHEEIMAAINEGSGGYFAFATHGWDENGEIVSSQQQLEFPEITDQDGWFWHDVGPSVVHDHGDDILTKVAPIAAKYGLDPDGMRLSNEPTWCDLGDLWIWRHGKAHAYECGPDGVAVVTERTLKIWLADEANTVEHMRNYLSALLPEGEEL